MTQPQPPWPEPAALMPHGPSMVLIEQVLECGRAHVVCRVLPGLRDAAHARGGLIPAAIGLEYMAQAACVFAGLHARPGERKKPGWVVAVRGLVVTVPGFGPGVPLTVAATLRWGDDRLARFATRIARDGERLSSAVLTVYHPGEAERA